ncbi:hypothetical protein PR001_g21570 [Phytophthora rubi]|uniref:Crinkler effector protein N-terminal domain-containing protein n=1 Tax=Phytophthora rubi TaxID=129364 RepID=A0A6A3J4G8_9STRA|nr:hypothetical protein PR002_g22264 [Phytophthora rubi]KAE8990176.1 hypothetical protein PR001_g21570 [Phytophthora rubi]
MLFCTIIGADVAPFPLDMRAADDIVGDLKDAIRAKGEVECPAYKLGLFLARKDDAWMTATDTPDDSWLQTELVATKRLTKAISMDLVDDVVHVLAKLPEVAEALEALVQVRKIRMMAQMRQQVEEEARHIANIPSNRKRYWDELNKTLKPKRIRIERDVVDALPNRPTMK